MKLALILHIYQPPTQYDNILDSITSQCYRPLLSLLIANPAVQVSFNIPASLVELWHKNYSQYSDIFSLFRKLSEREQIELLGSAAYHPLLFKLPKSEIYRQIKLNERINMQLLPGFNPGGGFFPPELALDSNVLDVVNLCGYEWVLSESPLANRRVLDQEPFYVLRAQGLGLEIVFRNKSLSLDLAFSRVSSVEEILNKDVGNPVIALDGETFGWHRRDGLELLQKMFEDNALSFCLASDLVKKQLPTAPGFKLEKISWGKRGSDPQSIYYPRWENPQNKVHKLQWQLTELAINAVNNSEFKIESFNNTTESAEAIESIDSLSPNKKQWFISRQLLDKAVHSDQYFWADGDNVWHLGMVEKGADMLRNVVCALPGAEPNVIAQANTLYDKIIATGEELYGKDVKA
ncbi:MAG: hypothetical protein U9M98_01320 [Patescibacteria group bacterium]|nr:hypothetical protein [Patescibacteria group bacterium]